MTDSNKHKKDITNSNLIYVRGRGSNKSIGQAVEIIKRLRKDGLITEDEYNKELEKLIK